MNIYLDNVNLGSTSGPNHFGSKLAKYMTKNGNRFTSPDMAEVQLSFIQANRLQPWLPMYQRLDGIYFNSAQDYDLMNREIKETYKKAKGVIFQSEFNKNLTFKYFGEHNNYKIIRNGADLELIDSVPPLESLELDNYESIWCCASSWRPHKRLHENIRYFLEHSTDRDCMVVAGDVKNPIQHDRVFYTGNLDVQTLISLYKRSDYFVHLAYLDHCPNVVVDASASGCKVICSSTGGTKEISGNSIIIEEQEWDLSPTRLYEPPSMNFLNKSENNFVSNNDMNYVALEYQQFLGE